MLVVGSHGVELADPLRREVVAGDAAGVGAALGVDASEHRGGCPRHRQPALTETERGPNCRTGLGVASVEAEPAGVQYDEPVAAAVVDPGALQQRTESVDRDTARWNVPAVHINGLVERAAAGDLERLRGDDGVPLRVRDRLALAALQHPQRLAGLEHPAGRLTALAGEHVDGGEAAVVVAQLGPDHLSVARPERIDRYEGVGEYFGLGGSPTAPGARADRIHEQRGGRPFCGSGVEVIPAGRFALQIQPPGDTPLGVVGIGDLRVGDLAEAGPGAVIGDEARVQQGVSHRPGRQGQVTRADQLRRPLATLAAFGQFVDGGGEHLDGGADTLEPGMLGPLLFGDVDQRRVERVAALHPLREPLRRGAEPGKDVLAPRPMHVLTEPSGCGGHHLGGWLIREQAATDDLGEVAAAGDGGGLAVADQ